MSSLVIASEPQLASGAALSGRVVGQLGPGEQLVLWALRQRLVDGETPSAAFLCGFRLAFGLAGLERALAAFERFFASLNAEGAKPGLFPLRCACISTEELAALALVARAQAQAAGADAGRLAEPAATLAFARCLEQVRLLLAQPTAPDRLSAPGTLH